MESANKPYAVVKRSHYSRHIARQHIPATYQGLATNAQDEQETRGTPLIEEIFISSRMSFMRFNSVFAGFIQGYIFSPQKILLCFSPIRPRSKVNRFSNHARFRINRTIHSRD